MNRNNIGFSKIILSGLWDQKGGINNSVSFLYGRISEIVFWLFSLPFQLFAKKCMLVYII